MVFAFITCSKDSSTPTPKSATYTVTFNTDDINTVVKAQTINSGAKATKPTDPTRIGYAFNGWYTDGNFTTVFDFTKPITANTTVYAKWTTVATYTVTFNTSDVNTVVATQTINSGDLATKPTDPTRAGYTFNGWYKEPTLAIPFTFTTLITANITIYAKWTFISIVTTLAGSTEGYADGTGVNAQFNRPFDVAVDDSGNIYVADTNNNRIRKITSVGVVSTLAGSDQGYAEGTVANAKFKLPTGVSLDVSGNIYVADEVNFRIRKITTADEVSTLAGSTQGYVEGTGATAKFYNPIGVVVDANGNIYVADQGNQSIRKITPDGVVSTLAGNGSLGYADGAGTSAQFRNPYDLAVDTNGNVYVADQGNHSIRKITPEGIVSTLAGNGSPGYADGVGANARFKSPIGVAVDASGNVYVADSSNNRIRKITTDGTVSTLAGSDTKGSVDGAGTNAQFNAPLGMAVDANSNIYVSCFGDSHIRKIQTKP